MPLEVEFATYDRELDSLIASAGKFALIKGEKVFEIFDTYEDALKIGYGQFGLDAFLVQRIEAMPTVHCFTRDINPCRT